MNDRAPIRDRTLVLRILVPGLETRLRDKMKDLEEAASKQETASPGGASSSFASSTAPKPVSSTTTGSGNSAMANKDPLLDLEGVRCEPTAAKNRTLWNFHCDGATYPAKLVNLPCPVEIHKTHDHAAYYKSQDVAQMLIVYEDEMALEEAETEDKPIEGFPSYYPSGLTPPMRHVVERRFAAREQAAVAPPRTAVADVEDQLVQLMEKLQKEEGGGGGGKGSAATKRSKLPALTSATKVLEEVEEEVVDYEPWMDDYGRQPGGIEMEAGGSQVSLHPEIWLPSEVIREIKQEDEAAKRKKQAAAEKKEARRKEKEKAQENARAQQQTPPSTKKKGIASKKNTEVVDEVTQAAMGAMNEEDLMGDVLGNDDFFKDFDLDFNDMDL